MLLLWLNNTELLLSTGCLDFLPPITLPSLYWLSIEGLCEAGTVNCSSISLIKAAAALFFIRSDLASFELNKPLHNEEGADILVISVRGDGHQIFHHRFERTEGRTANGLQKVKIVIIFFKIKSLW